MAIGLNFSCLPWSSPGLGNARSRTGPASGFVWNFFATNRERGGDANVSNDNDLCRRTPKMARLEAVLFVADEPLPIKRLMQLATLADADEAQTLIDRLNRAYDASDSTFRIDRKSVV